MILVNKFLKGLDYIQPGWLGVCFSTELELGTFLGRCYFLPVFSQVWFLRFSSDDTFWKQCLFGTKTCIRERDSGRIFKSHSLNKNTRCHTLCFPELIEVLIRWSPPTSPNSKTIPCRRHNSGRVCCYISRVVCFFKGSLIFFLQPKAHCWINTDVENWEQ